MAQFCPLILPDAEGQQIGRLALRSSTEIPDSRCVPIWSHLLWAAPCWSQNERFFLQHRAFSRIAGTKSRAPVIIAEQTEALEAFEIAAKQQAKKVLMMTGQSPMGRQLWLAQEHLSWPPSSPISLGCEDPQRLIRREIAEIELADALLSPSRFVTDSLRTHMELGNKPIFQANWPVWGNDLIVSRSKSKPGGRSLHVLFVGGITLHKGVMYLVKALEQMSPESYEARFVGGAKLPGSLLEQCRQVAVMVGHVPYSEMREQSLWADVFVLPSLSEGRARVVIEAMAAGLPVIVTPNTGAPVTDHENGILVQPRNVVAIIQALKELTNNSNLYSQISNQALQTARSFTVERYASELRKAICSI